MCKTAKIFSIFKNKAHYPAPQDRWGSEVYDRNFLTRRMDTSARAPNDLEFQVLGTF
jgi:hypothetical protein